MSCDKGDGYTKTDQQITDGIEVPNGCGGHRGQYRSDSRRGERVEERDSRHPGYQRSEENPYDHSHQKHVHGALVR
jgi:hypothetical protein